MTKPYPPVDYARVPEAGHAARRPVPAERRAGPARPRRDAVHRRPPGLRAVVQADPARAGLAPRPLPPGVGGRAEHRGRGRAPAARRGDREDPDRPAPRARDHDSPRLPGLPRHARPRLRLPERAVPAHREQAGPARRGAGGHGEDAGRRQARRRGRSEALRASEAGPRSSRSSRSGWSARRSWICPATRSGRATARRCGTCSREDRQTIEANPSLADAEKEAQLAELAQTEAGFEAVLDEKAHERAGRGRPAPALPPRHPRRPLHPPLSRPADPPPALPLPHPARGRGRAARHLALPARAHGAPHDRHQDRHRRLLRPPLPARHRGAQQGLRRPLRPLDLPDLALRPARRCPRRWSAASASTSRASDAGPYKDARSRRFLAANPGRLHFAAHSHHPWPDVTRQAVLDGWDDAARLMDRKWDRIFGRGGARGPRPTSPASSTSRGPRRSPSLRTRTSSWCASCPASRTARPSASSPPTRSS